MEFKTISYNSDLYRQVIALRQKILRDPLGMKFTKDDLEQDANEIICACIEENKILGCNQLASVNNDVVRLRQMAVDNTIQTKGIGSRLLSYAEDIARMNGFKTVELHARLTAKEFYLKNGYQVTSNIFTEVGIPHVMMRKELI